MKLIPIFFLICALFTAACQSKPPRPAFVPPPPTGILTASEVDQAPRILGRPARADYPFELRRAEVSGRASIRFIVTHDGRVIDVVVIEATHPAFGAAASDAVAKWKYQPAIKDGQPIACVLTVPVVFDVNPAPNRLAPPTRP